MPLRGSKITGVVAKLALEAERPDDVEVRSEVGVHLDDHWYYSAGSGIAHLPPRAGPLEDFFAGLADEGVEEVMVDVRRDGYDGPDWREVQPVTWKIEPELLAAQRRLDAS